MSACDGNVVGRVVKKVELRKANNGKSVASLGIARKKIGNKEESDFLYFDLWEKNAENCAQYTDVGALVNVYYRIYTKKEKVIDSTGREREITAYRFTATNVDFLVAAKSKESQGAAPAVKNAYEEPPYAPDDSEGLPFDL
jgi:single-strand DNA-binding protein